jgi:hypothetical protein
MQIESMEISQNPYERLNIEAKCKIACKNQTFIFLKPQEIIVEK